MKLLNYTVCSSSLHLGDVESDDTNSEISDEYFDSDWTDDDDDDEDSNNFRFAFFWLADDDANNFRFWYSLIGQRSWMMKYSEVDYLVTIGNLSFLSDKCCVSQFGNLS